MGTLGENVVELRQRQGLTRVQLAYRLEGIMSLGTLIRVEQNKHNLTVDKLMPLAEILNATPNELLGIDPLPKLPDGKSRGRFKQGVRKQIRGRRASGNGTFRQPDADQRLPVASGF